MATSSTKPRENQATMHFGTPEQERIRANDESTETNGKIGNVQTITELVKDVVLAEENQSRPIDATTIALIAVAISFGLVFVFIGVYFTSAKLRKRRQRAREVKEQKFKLGHQYEIVVSKPAHPRVVTPSDIYMNYY